MAEIPEFTTRPELAGTFGMVASTHWLASAAGMAVLEHGGNAFDAAVAAGLVLQVVEPHLNGPGGEVPVIAHHAGRGETFVLCGQGTAPAAATLEAFAGLGLDLVPGSGLLAACVPGAFGAWMLLLREFGTLRLRDVMGYAIGYAASGYPLLPAISWGIASVAELFRDHWPSSAEVYLPGGRVPAPGTRFANPALAATYQRILDEAEAASQDRDEQIEAARRVYYEGFVAEAIAAYLASAEVMDVTGRPHRGLLSYADLAGWHPRLEEPLTYDFGGLTVCKTKPWGQGPVFLQQLALLDGFDLAAMGPGSADFIHTVTECGKLAFADREAWYGDPDFTDVPVKALLSAEYADERRRLVGPEASAELRPGRPGRTAAPAAGLRRRRVRRAPATTGACAGPGRAAARAAAGPGHGRADDAHQRPGPDGRLQPPGRRHLPPRRRRPVRQHGLRHAERRLAAVVAGHPRPRLLPRHPGADVHPHPRSARHARAGQAAAHHADPEPRAAGRRAVPGVRHARRRPAGPVDAAVLPQPPDVRHEPAAGDRLPVVPLRAHAVVVLPAQAAAPRARRRVAGRRRVIDELRRRGHLVSVRPAWSLGRVSAVARRDGMLYAAANPRGMQGYAVGR